MCKVSSLFPASKYPDQEVSFTLLRAVLMLDAISCPSQKLACLWPNLILQVKKQALNADKLPSE